MDLKKLFFILLILSLIFSISAVSALENNTSENTESIESEINEITEQNNLKISQDMQISLQKENSRVIYVGQNKTTNGGNGTQNNPFNSFELACNNLSGEEKVEINVYNGSYYLDSDLKFNTSNLIITGMDKVTIKNLKNESGVYASFGLTSSNGNFTFNNLIFDGVNFQLTAFKAFNVFKGNANLGIFNNCTFINFTSTYIVSGVFDKKFNNCNFIGVSNKLGFFGLHEKFNMEFNDCVISALSFGNNDFSIHANIIFNNVWFGSNNLPGYVYYRGCDDRGYWVYGQMFTVNRYAIWSASENYIGNDTFEILGKLTWNDSTTEGIEKLSPMTVHLSSITGNLTKNNVTLENGTFKVIYKSNSKDNLVTAVLDNEEFNLKFTKDISASVIPITYGDDQNVTVKLPKSVNTIVYISVNNKTYEVTVNNSNIFNFTIPDELLAGS